MAPPSAAQVDYFKKLYLNKYPAGALTKIITLLQLPPPPDIPTARDIIAGQVLDTSPSNAFAKTLRREVLTRWDDGKNRTFYFLMNKQMVERVSEEFRPSASGFDARPETVDDLGLTQSEQRQALAAAEEAKSRDWDIQGTFLSGAEMVQGAAQKVKQAAGDRKKDYDRLKELSEDQDVAKRELDELFQRAKWRDTSGVFEWLRANIEYYRVALVLWIRRNLKSNKTLRGEWNKGYFQAVWRLPLLAITKIKDALVEVVIFFLTSARFWYYVARALLAMKEKLCRYLSIKLSSSLFDVRTDEEYTSKQNKMAVQNFKDTTLSIMDAVLTLAGDSVSTWVRTTFGTMILFMADLPGFGSVGPVLGGIIAGMFKDYTEQVFLAYYFKDGGQAMINFITGPCIKELVVYDQRVPRRGADGLGDTILSAVYNTAKRLTESRYDRVSMINLITNGQTEVPYEVAQAGEEQVLFWNHLVEEYQRNKATDPMYLFKKYGATNDKGEYIRPPIITMPYDFKPRNEYEAIAATELEAQQSKYTEALGGQTTFEALVQMRANELRREYETKLPDTLRYGQPARRESGYFGGLFG